MVVALGVLTPAGIRLRVVGLSPSRWVRYSSLMAMESPAASSPQIPHESRRSLRLVVLGVGGVVAAVAIVMWAMKFQSARPSDLDAVWNAAENAINQGQIEPARRLLETLEQARTPVAEDWFLRGQIEIAEGEPDLAIASLSKVPDDHKLAAQAAYITGRIERDRFRMRLAEAAYNRAVRLEPRFIPARRELVYILGMQIRRKEINEQFRTLASLTPLNHHDLFTWGLTHFTVWGPDSAEDLEKFIAADPEDRASRVALATMLIDQPGTEDRVEKALAPLPADDAEVVALRAELKLNHGQIDEAKAMLEKSKAKGPRLAMLRGRLALVNGDADGAIAEFNRALSDEPYDRVSIANLGKALLLKGDRSAAEKYLARARKLDQVYNLINKVSRSTQENQAVDLKNLGKACEDAGLVDEARGWYTLAISRDPLDQESQQALHRL